ncbi:MAG TPA: hypothetical protein VLT33_28615, partial [Labilithrix sp.]|nr:hypothetical protein [Labilithrix sp.]
MSSTLLKLSVALAGALVFAACAAPTDDVDDGASAVSAEQPLSYVGQAVTSALDAAYADEKGTTWNLARDGKLSGDFVKQFPPRATWGKDSLAIAKRCEATDPTCDKDFLLFTCQRDADCNGAG